MDFSNIVKIALAIASIIGIWLGSGLVVKHSLKLARNMGLSPFFISFFILGFLTSLPEIFIAIDSYVAKEPEISAGNLIGGIIILFFFLIPLLTILIKRTQLNHNFSKPFFFINIILLILPAFFLLDKELSSLESMILLIGCLIIFAGLSFKNNNHEGSPIFEKKKLKREGVQLSAIILGMIILIFSSEYLVRETLLIAHELGADPFVISIVGLSIGTNLPEISLAIKSVLTGKKEIALGNYMGSALVNILILGVLGQASGTIKIASDFTPTFIIMAIGLSIFWLLMLSKNKLTRSEGFVILIFYILFILAQANILI